jgi:signal transduction histidine kinase
MKLPALADPALAANCDIRQLTSDLFHELIQPLTNLCCSLELALIQSPTTEQYGQIVSQALLQAQKASGLATAIRELLDASHPGEKGELLDLSHAVWGAVEDMLPVAESAGVKIAYLPQSACPVWFDAHRLRQGFFHLLGSLIGGGGQGSVLQIELETRGPQARLSLTVSGVTDGFATSERQLDRDLLQRLELGISRSIFEAAGGSFSVERGAQCLTVSVEVLRKAS